MESSGFGCDLIGEQLDRTLVPIHPSIHLISLSGQLPTQLYTIGWSRRSYHSRTSIYLNTALQNRATPSRNAVSNIFASSAAFPPSLSRCFPSTAMYTFRFWVRQRYTSPYVDSDHWGLVSSGSIWEVIERREKISNWLGVLEEMSPKRLHEEQAADLASCRTNRGDGGWIWNLNQILWCSSDDMMVSRWFRWSWRWLLCHIWIWPSWRRNSRHIYFKPCQPCNSKEPSVSSGMYALLQHLDLSSRIKEEH